MKKEVETGGTQPRAQGCLQPQKLEEAGRTVPWSLSRDCSPAQPGSQQPCPAWISVVQPLLDLSGPALPGSQQPALPGSQRPCPAWISAALLCLDLSDPALPGSQQPFPAWISVTLPCLDLSGPAPPGSQ